MGRQAMADFVVKSKVQALVKELNMRLSGDALGVIDDRVQSAVKKAAKRAQANGRKTIQSQDF
jgi:histone H3/H4